jgi:hypothetical protein
MAGAERYGVDIVESKKEIINGVMSCQEKSRGGSRVHELYGTRGMVPGGTRI